MARRKRRWATHRGSALPMSVFAAVILIVLGVGLLGLGIQGRIISIRDAEQIQARCAADAGLTMAVYQMNSLLGAKAFSENSMPSATNQSLPNSEATFSYTVAEDLETDDDFLEDFDDETYEVMSVGRFGQAQKVVYATLRFKGLFDNAIVVKDRISLMPNTLVSSYNSEDPSDTDRDLVIGTTSISDNRIPLGPGTVVEGDVYVGVGGDPGSVIGAGGTITGRKYSLIEVPEFPLIKAPELSDKGDLSAKGTNITLGPGDTGAYDTISLANSAILEITGGDVVLHITGNISMGSGCEIVVREDSSLILYVDGDISGKNSVGFNNEAGIIKDFTLYGTNPDTQTFELKAKSNVFGAVYAPNANLTIYPASEMHGAIVANNAVFKSGNTFYYDEALQEVDENDIGVKFEVKRWFEN